MAACQVRLTKEPILGRQTRPENELVKARIRRSLPLDFQESHRLRPTFGPEAFLLPGLGILEVKCAAPFEHPKPLFHVDLAYGGHEFHRYGVPLAYCPDCAGIPGK